MGGFDDYVAGFGDWIPPSPSPTALLSSLLVDDVGGWSPYMEHTNESKCRNLVVEPQQHVSSDGMDGARAGAETDQTVKLSAPSEQKMSSRGGLMERMAARAGFTAPRLNTDGIRPPILSQNQEVRSPYLSIPAGLSPSVLLDSPVLIYNSLVYPSPTTGILPFALGDESKSVMLTTGAADKRKETAFGSNNSSSFSVNPIMQTDRVNPSSLSQQLFPQIEVSVHPNNSLQPHSMEATQNEWTHRETSNFPTLSTEEDVRGSDIKTEARNFKLVGGSMENSQQDEDTKQKVGEDSNDVDVSAEDGYNWREYGQNQVKGSEYSQTYYECTHPSCPIKKKIERHHEGQVTEIKYSGAHTHPKPLPNPSSALGSSNSFGDMPLDNVDPSGTGVKGELALATFQQGPTAGDLAWKYDNLEATSAALQSEYCNGTTTLHANSAQLGSADAADEDEDDRGTHGGVLLGSDGGGGHESESKSKRRKIEPIKDKSGVSKPIKEPRVVVQTTSEVDILDDGYRWRKYGQKVVKGNPSPRSYYRCTTPGCNVRKQVERAAHDLKSVITTYEGKHNHDVPAARRSRVGRNSLSNCITTPRQNTTKVYGRAPPLGSFGATSGFNAIGTNQQQGLGSPAMAGFNSDQHKVTVPVHPYIGQPQPVNDAGFMLPQGEPMSDPSLNYFNGSST
ncbi:WRKY transcription factor [Datura stramonium]|uniref:WRKY transcription factor n=1 Tax=Datura stramonium TaxID=4076 RepID=A0ABS8SBL3_DATST|nr:WRKY transcription factor [Datura stramonium]